MRLVEIRQRSWFASVNRVAEELLRDRRVPRGFSALVRVAELGAFAETTVFRTLRLRGFKQRD
jgi:hypothetical protein